MRASEGRLLRERSSTRHVHPQVSVKISGFGMFDPAWTVDSIRPFVRTTIDLFGVERCMFASNFPVDKVFRSYAEVYEAFDTLTADLSAADRAKLPGLTPSASIACSLLVRTTRTGLSRAGIRSRRGSRRSFH